MKINQYKLLVYITFALLLLDPIFNIGVDTLDLTKVYIAGIPAADYALMLMMITFFVKLNHITSFVSIKMLVIIGLAFVFYLVQGVIINGTSNFAIFNADIRTWLWFFGGIGFAYSILRTEKPILFLKIIVIVSTLLLVVSSIKSAGFDEYFKGFTVSRIGHPNIYIMSGWIFTPIILLFNITTNTFIKKIVPFISTILFFYFVGILSNTRSSTIIAILLFLLYTISFKFRTHNSKLFISKIKISNKLYLTIFVLIIFVYFAYYLGIERKSRLLSVVEMETLLNDSRFFELISFFDNSNSSQLLFGRGFGGSVPSPTYQMKLTSTLHIGLLNFWMKMGFIPFLFITYFLFIKIPIRYIRSFNLITSKKSNYYHTANVCILSTLFPWIISLILSGGFNEISFLFAGFVMYFYGIVKSKGLNSIIK